MADPIGIFTLLGSIAVISGIGVVAERSKSSSWTEKVKSAFTPKPEAPKPAPAPAPNPEEPQNYPETAEQKAVRDAVCRRVLEGLNPPVRTRKEWLTWVAKNHPDKGGDTALFQQASNCFDRLYKSGGLRKKTFKARRGIKTNGRRTRHR